MCADEVSPTIAWLQFFLEDNSPAIPATSITMPPTSSHIARSVGAPVKNLDISELLEL